MNVKIIKKGRNKNIIFQNKISQGQKKVEDLKVDEEIYYKFKSDQSIEKTKFLFPKNLKLISKNLKRIKDKENFINLAKLIYPQFKNDKKKIKISNVI